MKFKSDAQRRAVMAQISAKQALNEHQNPRSISNRKIEALTGDEKMAHTEYEQLARKASNNKVRKLFYEMARDEKRHANNLRIIKEEVN